MWSFKPKITKEQAIKEIEELREAYKKEYPAMFARYGGSGFLVGSSLIGNSQGDSARYWELRSILEGK